MSKPWGHAGCCTSCAVRVKEGQIRQPEALGISAELKSKGYALLCVGFPSSNLEVETQDEDKVYWHQFGRYFARGPIISFVRAIGSEEPNDYEGGIITDVPPVYFELQERGDYALVLAMANE